MIIYNLRNSRENMDLKQKDIAEMFGVHFATVSGWETGKDTIPLERLIEYANRFNFSLDYLFGITKQNDTSYLPLEIDLNVIAQNLRKVRKSHNLTQEDVAKRINTDVSVSAGRNKVLCLGLGNLRSSIGRSNEISGLTP